MSHFIKLSLVKIEDDLNFCNSMNYSTQMKEYHYEQHILYNHT
jgi:hypothetical protein